MRGGWDIVSKSGSEYNDKKVGKEWIDGQLTCLEDTAWVGVQRLQRLVLVRGKSFVSR